VQTVKPVRLDPRTLEPFNAYTHQAQTEMEQTLHRNRPFLWSQQLPDTFQNMTQTSVTLSSTRSSNVNFRCSSAFSATFGCCAISSLRLRFLLISRSAVCSSSPESNRKSRARTLFKSSLYCRGSCSNKIFASRFSSCGSRWNCMAPLNPESVSNLHRDWITGTLRLSVTKPNQVPTLKHGPPRTSLQQKALAKCANPCF
jgi:hypothetical protein